MACFTVPLAETIIASGIKAVLKRRQNKKNDVAGVGSGMVRKLGWLQKLGFGGSALLAIEHVYHGEITYVPPFLTAMNSPETTQEMIQELATSGVAMALLITAVWGVMCIIAHVREKKAATASEEK